ncbi:MAG: hypothetical protein M3R13_11260 [Armatimonadota bacterium]|nr:hypothetical protein [Armatimonadota bacterium]
MESSSEPKQRWPSWLIQLAVIRIGGAISGLGVSYWAEEHLASGAGARFIGNSSAVANSLEAITALLVGLFLVRAVRFASIFIAVGCSLAAVVASIYPGEGSLWLIRAADGVLAGLATTSALSQVLSRANSEPKGARLLVAFESMVIVSFALGSVAASLLWRPFASKIFLVTAVLYLVSIFATHTKPSTRAHTVRPVLPRNPLFLGVLAMSASASMWVSQVTFVLTGQKVPGQLFPGLLDKPGVSIVVVTYLIATGIGLSLWGLVLPKVNVQRGSLVAAVAAIIAPVLLLFSNMSPVADSVRRVCFGLYLIALLIQTGLIPTFMAISNRTSNAETAVQLASALVVSTAFGSIIGPLLGGIIVANFSFAGLCIGSCILAVLALAALNSGMRDRHNRVVARSS